MKGLFIPDITAEMFRNGCLESIEVLMAEGEIYDIEYSPWIPIKTRPCTDEEYEEFGKYSDCPREDFLIFTNHMPDDNQEVLITTRSGDVCLDIWHRETEGSFFEDHDDLEDVIAWMPKPERYEPEVQDD